MYSKQAILILIPSFLSLIPLNETTAYFSLNLMVPICFFPALTSDADVYFLTEAALHSLLGALTSETYDNTTQHLEREQALAKQFAEILHFTLRFDELKVPLSLPAF